MSHLILISLLGHLVEATELANSLLLTPMGTLKTFHTHWDGQQYTALSQGPVGFPCSATIVSSGF